MSRSTDPERAKRLNAAHALLARGEEMAKAADILVNRYGVSRRQAYRYLEEVQELGHPVPVGEVSVPMTIKVPESVAQRLREESRTRGLAIGEIVARAVRDWVARERGRG
uniref:CopG domain protein DNA-binding domain protein n=1 Tax=Leptospirillum ferrodiazotrophum TaxID=412449 RepID=C6HTN2_9BACT|nr:MAG: CopG domain protein DNA-binding domain protein [Leptospirillum ferrodiazotrophum]